jgi:hypothetical protein
MGLRHLAPSERVQRGRVEFVSDSGVIVLQLEDGQRRTTTVHPRSVALVRRLAELDRELDLELL